MSTEDTVRAAIACYAAGDLEGALRHCAEDVCFCNRAAAGTGMWTYDCAGVDALRDALVAINTEFDIRAYSLIDLLVAGARAASRQSLSLVHRATGRTFETEIADFWVVEDRKIVSIIEFNDTALIAVPRIAAGEA